MKTAHMKDSSIRQIPETVIERALLHAIIESKLPHRDDLFATAAQLDKDGWYPVTWRRLTESQLPVAGEPKEIVEGRICICATPELRTPFEIRWESYASPETGHAQTNVLPYSPVAYWMVA